MFYKAIGLAVWKMARAYIRQNYGQRIKQGAGAAAFLAVLGIGYLFTRDREDAKPH
jgi:hypothetical protein